MQYMSEELAALMQRPLRPAGEIKIECDITDVSAAREARLAAADALYYSDVQHADTESAVPRAVTATFEPQRFRLDGTMLAAPAVGEAVGVNEGYISASLCGADGAFAAPPEVNVTLASRHSVSTLTLAFDAVRGTYPESVTVTAYRSGVIIYEKSFAPSSAVLQTDEAITGFDALKIRFNSMRTPHARARLQQLMFGRMQVFGADMLGGAEIKYTQDVLMRRMPEATLTFKAVNCTLDGKAGINYAPDAENSDLACLEQPCPVRASYGMPCEGGVQWVALGRFYLTGQPQADDVFVTLKAASVLDLLTDTCTVDTENYTNRTLYDEAQRLLDAAGIDMFYAGGVSRRLWDGLKGFETCAPMPKKPYRECLQYIAHAAGCVLYTSREGTLCIMPPSDVQNALYIDYDMLLARPKASKNAALSRVICKIYAYDGGDVSTSTVTETVDDAETGAEEETVDNPLITNSAAAIMAAYRTRRELLHRNVYECEYRGLPALEAGDCVYLQGLAKTKLRVRIAEHTLSFTNGLTGKFKAKGLD